MFKLFLLYLTRSETAIERNWFLKAERESHLQTQNIFLLNEYKWQKVVRQH